MDDMRVKNCLEKYQRMVTDRSPFESDWNDIRDLVRPMTVSFNQTTGTFNTVRPDTMYDGTAPEALEELGAALHSYLTNPAERWFELQIEGQFEPNQDPDTMQWLELVSDIIYNSYRRTGVNFDVAMHECYLDTGSFGTCILNQEWSTKLGDLIFSAKPLAACHFLENSEGQVDTVARKVFWTLRQIKQEFGEVLPPKLMAMTDDTKMIEVLQLVYPRTDRLAQRYDQKNKRFASVWISITTKELLLESGYDGLPYHVARWTKMSGETYGRGPARKCLPDIKMLNSMERTLLKAGQKQVDPPLVLRNEGFMLPIRTSPGALIFKEDEESTIEALRFEGNLPWGEEKAKQKREFIEKCFYADWIRMEKDNKEMTAYEVADRRDEKLRLLAPMMGRLVGELHGPMIARSYELLSDHGKIPGAPIGAQRRQLKIGYLSPAARAQLGTKATLIARYLQDIIPLAQINPDIMDIIDMDNLAASLALIRGVPRTVLRSPEAIAMLREQKNKMRAMQEAAAVAEPVTKSIKNLADANQMPALGGLQ